MNQPTTGYSLKQRVRLFEIEVMKIFVFRIAFIEFQTTEEAAEACEKMDSVNLGGRSISVMFGKEDPNEASQKSNSGLFDEENRRGFGRRGSKFKRDDHFYGGSRGMGRGRRGKISSSSNSF